MGTCMDLSPARRLAAGFVLDSDGAWVNAHNVNVLNMRDSVERMTRADGTAEERAEAESFVSRLERQYAAFPDVAARDAIKAALRSYIDRVESHPTRGGQSAGGEWRWTNDTA